TGVQTHVRPDGGADLERLSRALGFSSSGSFVEDLATRMAAVHALFVALVPGEAPAPVRWTAAIARLERNDATGFAAAIAAEAARALSELRRRRPRCCDGRGRSGARGPAAQDVLRAAQTPRRVREAPRRRSPRAPQARRSVRRERIRGRRGREEPGARRRGA